MVCWRAIDGGLMFKMVRRFAIVAAAVVAAVVGWNMPRIPLGPVSVAGPKIPADMLWVGGGSSEGNKAAPVVLIEYSDFVCPFCRRFAERVLPELREQYIATGQMRVIFRNFPLASHRMALPAAVLAGCAARYGRFVAMHDYLFRAPLPISEETLTAGWRDLALGDAEAAACREQQTEQIEDDRLAGVKLGVRATPTFFVGTTTGNDRARIVRIIEGVEDVTGFRETIERLLKS